MEIILNKSQEIKILSADKAQLEDEILELTDDVNIYKEVISKLKDKIDFYEGELHRRGYVLQPEEE